MIHPDWLLNTSFLLSLPSSCFVSFPLNLNHKVLLQASISHQVLLMEAQDIHLF